MHLLWFFYSVMSWFHGGGVDCNWHWFLLLLSSLIQKRWCSKISAAKQQSLWQWTLAQATIPPTNLSSKVADPAAFLCAFCSIVLLPTVRWWGKRGRCKHNNHMKAAVGVVVASGSNVVQKGLRSCRQHKDMWTKITFYKAPSDFRPQSIQNSPVMRT